MKIKIISLCAIALMACACNKSDTPRPCAGSAGIPCEAPVQEDEMSTRKPAKVERMTRTKEESVPSGERLTDTAHVVPGKKPKPRFQL